MANTRLEAINPKDPKNKHLYYLWPYIVYSRNFGPNGPSVYGIPKEIVNTFNFEKDIKEYVDKNIDEICKEFDARWISALMDTYADLSEDVGEKLGATNISSLIRITQATTSNMYHRGVMGEEFTSDIEKRIIKYQSKYNLGNCILWSGMHAWDGRDGIYTNLFYRIKQAIKTYPTLDKLYTRAVNILVTENTSLFPNHTSLSKLQKEILKIVNE